MLFKTYYYKPLLAVLTLLLLAGCGWQLRDQASLPESVVPIYIQGPSSYSKLYRDMVRILRGSGIPVAEEQSEAAALLRIRDYQTNNRILSLKSDTGKAAEYELHNYMNFDLVDAAGNELVEEQKVSLTRTYLRQRYGVLDSWNDEMRRDLINQMLRRLQARLR